MDGAEYGGDGVTGGRERREREMEIAVWGFVGGERAAKKGRGGVVVASGDWGKR